MTVAIRRNGRERTSAGTAAADRKAADGASLCNRPVATSAGHVRRLAEVAALASV
jgi:hypothetical protein